MGLGQRTVSDHCDRFFAHLPIPPVSSRQWAFITAEFLRQYLLSSAPARQTLRLRSRRDRHRAAAEAGRKAHVKTRNSDRAIGAREIGAH